MLMLRAASHGCVPPSSAAADPRAHVLPEVTTGRPPARPQPTRDTHSQPRSPSCRHPAAALILLDRKVANRRRRGAATSVRFTVLSSERDGSSLEFRPAGSESAPRLRAPSEPRFWATGDLRGAVSLTWWFLLLPASLGSDRPRLQAAPQFTLNRTDIITHEF